MLKKVRTIWIDGYLERSLPHETRILLGLSENPDAVTRPLDLLVQRTDQGEQPLPPGRQVVGVFDAMDQALLILGAPGSGKTTLLLELAHDLLDRAARDETHPIPVVLPLSTWAERRRPLAEWLVDELNKRYDVPLKLARAWAEADQILPLLDGLDEVNQEHRTACVEAINDFRNSHGLSPLVISSRTADYHALAAKLRLQGALVVQPLTRRQADSYLVEIGPAGTAVREAIRHDPTMWDLLDTPLMLTIVTLAYAGGRDPHFLTRGTLEERRDRLFAAYVDQMFRRRSVGRRYTQQQTVHWLAWLAWQMVRRSQTVFYIERLQPDWISRGQRWAFGLAHRLFGGLLGGLLGGLFFGLSTVLIAGLGAKLSYGLFTVLLFGLLGGLAVEPSREIVCIEAISWSWPKKDLGAGLAAGLSVVVGGGLAGDLVFGLVFGLVCVLGGLLLKGLSVSNLDISYIPNQGIHRSAWYALVFGLLGGLGLGLAVGSFGGLGYGLITGLSGGLLTGVSVGLFRGGRACLGHLMLRLVLVRNGSAPRDYARFLDYAAERILLRKVGGGYIFIHRMLMGYFAARYDESPLEKAPIAKRSSIESATPSSPSA